MLKILTVEDEISIRGFIKVNLERDGYNVIEADNGERALEIAVAERPEIALLDVGLPGMDGFELLRKLRQLDKNMGIIMLTAKSQDLDKINGLQGGCDDYITKPFNPTELKLRIASLARRIKLDEEPEQSMILDEPFKIDLYARKFYKFEVELELTPTEYQIMKLFIENPGRAFKRDEIMNLVWGYDFIGDSKIVDVNIRRLRTKIEDDSAAPVFIQTVWGMGYRWRAVE